jgi:hypothetical protein
LFVTIAESRILVKVDVSRYPQVGMFAGQRLGGRMTRVGVGLLLCVWLAACAALPAAEKAGALGDSISATGKVMRASIAANRSLSIKVGEEDQSNKYIKKENFTLNDAPGALLPKRDIAARLAALSALEEYGDALAKAVDQGTVDKLEQSAVNLGSAAAGLAVAAGPPGSLVLAPVIKVAARVGGFLLGNAYANEIHAVIVSRNNDVKGIVGLLRKDMRGIAALVNQNAKLYASTRKGTLLLIREDPNVDRQQLYTEYKAARQDVASIQTLADAAAKYDDVLTALVQAHDAIANDKPDGELLLRNFVAISADLSELIKNVRKENS